jgi:hypothetical protein
LTTAAPRWRRLVLRNPWGAGRGRASCGAQGCHRAPLARCGSSMAWARGDLPRRPPPRPGVFLPEKGHQILFFKNM